MIKNENDSGEIKLKTKSDLDKKTFFDNKENAYRVKKLIKLMEILKKPDFDIDLDEMKFTKIPKYKNYSLVKLTKPELSKILRNYDLREETYLNFLGIQKIDKDTYSLQLDIFIDKFIRINLKEITFEENVEAIFTMFDKDKNERITKEEVTDLLNFFQETNQLGFDQKTLANVSEAIFRQMADSGQSYISKNSLAKYLNKYAEEDITINPFTKVKTSDAVTKLKRNNTTKITSEEEKVLERINRKKDRSKINKFWVLNKKMIIWTIIYSILCVVIGFINRSLEGGRQYATTKAARFFAGIIFFNMAILVLYMCNFILTFLSSTRLKFYLPLNDTKLYHAVCASVLGVAVIPHVLIHIFGDYREIAALTAKKPKDAYVTVAWLTFANLTGATGVICLIIFSMLIILPHIKPLINKKYEVFLHSHKLFYLALVMLLLHANTPDTKRWPFLAFMALPILLFIVELCVRFYRYCKLRPKILRIKYLRSGVIFLELEKPFKFEYKCGQYAQINIPKISKWQYHPFTFASSPCDDTLFFYINPVGDWTKDLKSLGNADKESTDSKKELLLDDKDSLVYLDAPYGAPAEHFNTYEHVIFVAGGVGVTPFVSILISLLYKLKKGENLTHKSVSFYWIQREYEKTDYINNILEEIAVEDKNKLFDINIFITSAQQRFDFRSLFIAEGIEIAKKNSKGQNFSEICCGNVYWGRPEWDEIFKKKTLKFRREGVSKIGVFVCANNDIVGDLYEACENYSSAAVMFELNPEHF